MHRVATPNNLAARKRVLTPFISQIQQKSSGGRRIFFGGLEAFLETREGR
jgi:hypothetical protein